MEIKDIKKEVDSIHDSLQDSAAENDIECFEDCLKRLRELSEKLI